MDSLLPETGARGFAEQLAAASRRGVVREYRSRSIVLAEGERTGALHVLLSGRVRVFVGALDRREMELAVLGPGDWFGAAAYDGGAAFASVVSLEPCRVLLVPREELAAFVLACPPFANRFIGELVSQVRQLTQQLAGLALLDAQERIMRLLAEEAIEAGHERFVPRRPSQAQLAARAGCSREMVSRVMRALALEGAISLEPDRIVLHGEPRPAHARARLPAGP